jgi:hypothetical protein
MGSIALCIALALWATPARANHIDTCSHACATNCETAGYTEANCQTAVDGKCLVEEDITCTSSDPGIGLYQGTDLLFERGYKLSCPTNNCNSAVTIKGSPSSITTDLDGTGTGLGGTGGGFNVSINCGGWNDSLVDHIRVIGGVIGIANCETVTDNIVEGYDRTVWTVNRGIMWTQKVNSGSGADTASGNLVREKVWAITAGGSGTKVTVEDNNIMTSAYNAVAFLKDAWAVWNAVRDNNIHGSGDAAYSNFFYGTDPVIFSGSTTGATATNLCSIDDHPGCDACMTAGTCFDYVPQ